MISKNVSLKVLFAASECTPIAKVGGLGDVIGALPKALRALGADVRVALPYYERLHGQELGAEKIAECTVVMGGEKEMVRVYSASLRMPGLHDAEHGLDAQHGMQTIPLFLFENDRFLSHGEIYFERSAMVGSIAEIERFTFFSLAVAEWLTSAEWQPTIVHAHDWHTGLLPKKAKDAGYAGKTVFTIHNLQNQGRWNAADMASAVGSAYAFKPFGSDVNLIAEGIQHADEVTTVSPSYAKEILTPEFGEGLEQLLAERQDCLAGIVNGIDTERFDPSRDEDIASRYDASSVRDGKAENKKRLQQELNLHEHPRAPLFGMVARFPRQKGVDLVVEAIPSLVLQGGQFVLLGTGEATIEKLVTDAAARYPRSVFCKIGFDAELAQRIYAASDFFLMPSRFEPCGLGQLIAMRYGTIPIVRDTGGLRDTVQAYGDGSGTGFVFKEFNEAAFLDALTQALAVREDDAAWHALRERAMGQDFSWTASAQKYLALYQNLLKTN